MMRKIAWFVALILAFSLTAPEVNEASFAETSLYELVNDVDTAVVATVVHKKPIKIQEQTLIEDLMLPANLPIVTLVTLEVQMYVRNPVNKSNIVIVVPGGSIDGMGYDTSITPRFTVGKQYLLFISSLNKKEVSNSSYKDWYYIPCGSMCTFEVENNRIKRNDIFMGSEDSIPLEESISQIRAVIAH